MTNFDLMKKYIIGYVKDFIKEYYKATDMVVIPLGDHYNILLDSNEGKKEIFYINCYTTMFDESGVVITQKSSSSRICIPVDKAPIIITPIPYTCCGKSKHYFNQINFQKDEYTIFLCRYITFRMCVDGLIITDSEELEKQNIEVEDIKGDKMFTTTEIFNPDYWHVGDAVKFWQDGKVNGRYALLTRYGLIEKVNYNSIEIEYIDGIRVGMTIKLDEVKSGKVSIQKLS